MSKLCYCENCDSEFYYDELDLNKYGKECCPYCFDIYWSELTEVDHLTESFWTKADRLYEERRDG